MGRLRREGAEREAELRAAAEAAASEAAAAAQLVAALAPDRGVAVGELWRKACSPRPALACLLEGIGIMAVVLKSDRNVAVGKLRHKARPLAPFA